MMRSLLTFLFLTLFSVSAFAQAPAGASIVVTSPKAGDVVPPGPLQIKSTFSGDLTSPIIYEYTTDGGGFWMYIGEFTFSGGTPASNTFTWQSPPDIAIPQAQIRLRDAAGNIGVSGVFSFAPQAYIEVLMVNNGENPIPTDTDIQITWTTVGDPGTIDLSYNIDGVRTTIANNLPGSTMSYTWHTPSTPLQDVYFLLESDKANDLEVGPFRIQAPTGVKDVVVNGGVTPIPADRDVVISWTVMGEPGLIDLSYEVGGFPYVIANDLAGTTTSYTWRTPNTTQPEVFIVVNPENGQEVTVGPFALQEVMSVGDDPAASFAVSVYPNPAANVLSVSCENVDGDITVSLTDLTGKQVLTQSARGGKIDLDVSMLASGSYVLTAQQGTGTVTKRVNIQR